MSAISVNWVGKDERKVIAENHTREMEKLYSRQIATSALGTKTYGALAEYPKTYGIYNYNMDISLVDEDSVSAIFNHRQGKTAVLNFASYKHPGGMFLDGSKAQEECLCHESFLYNVLSRHDETYYAWNKKNLNRSLYRNRALYSPAIGFFKDDKTALCDVITCAAPNYTSAKKYGAVTKRENLVLLDSRIKFVLDIAEANKVDTLILGAFGCGVFGQDPYEVASMFKEYLEDASHVFEKVVFAIPKSSTNNNFEQFELVFRK